MSLLALQQVDFRIGNEELLRDASLAIEPGERIAIVGRNGCGKSTTLKLVAGIYQPDAGEITKTQGLTIAALPQEVPRGLSGSVYRNVASGLGEAGALLSRYEDALAFGDGDQITALQEAIEAAHAWNLDSEIRKTLSRLTLDPSRDASGLSGGEARSLLLAQAFVSAPELLLLDEPTNHLDIGRIDRLEELLQGFGGALLFVTHDRAFLRSVATRIVDLDRGHLRAYDCDYETFLRRREDVLAAEEKAAREFDKKLAQEETWIRTGIKARRTRNEGRVRALKKMREERKARRSQLGKAKMQLAEGGTTGKMVFELEDVSFSYPQSKPLIEGLSTRILRGDKVGIIGPNGAGKSTLIKLLLKDLEPTSGSIRHGTNLEVAYFDQHRDTLDENSTAQEVVSEGATHVTIGDRRKHILGYLQDFLFDPGRARSPIKDLSGGERNRLLLAKLFTKPANVLVLDEPTNDLDVETLELLETLLVEFSGTVLLISHDRAFLNDVVTSLFAFDADGQMREYVGGYDDWLSQRPQITEAKPAKVSATPVAAAPIAAAKKKLSYHEKRELETLPETIDTLESRHRELVAQLADPTIYTDADRIKETQATLAEVESEIENAMQRWETLEERV